jgi:hypothetical protein
MLAEPELTARLRELHDDFVWRVNAAVAEGREDLVRQLPEQYLEEAVRMLATDVPACGRPDCVACSAPRTAPRRRRGWRGLLGSPPRR